MTHYRSGSNWLLSLLRSHPQVVCHSEVFFPKRIYWGSAAYALGRDDADLLRMRADAPGRFLSDAVFRPYAPRIRAVGFKLMYPQAAREGLAAALLAGEGLRVIHLRRRNLLRVLVSQKLARRTNAMSSTSASDTKRRLEAVGRIELTGEECREHFERLTRERKDWKDRAGLTLDYEDLRRDPQGVVGRAFDFLDVPRREVASRLVRQTTKPLPEIVENFGKLEAEFRGTEWEWLFRDEENRSETSPPPYRTQ